MHLQYPALGLPDLLGQILPPLGGLLHKAPYVRGGVGIRRPLPHLSQKLDQRGPYPRVAVRRRLTLLLQETALALHLLQQGQIAFSQLSQLLLPLQLPAALLLQPQPLDQQPQKAAGGQRCSGTCDA